VDDREGVDVDQCAVRQCEIDGCGNLTRSTRKDLCEKHYYRHRRHGHPLTLVNRKPDVKYRAAHARVASDRGPASAQRCIDCSGSAEQWSYTHTDPNVRYSPGGQPYSLSSEHYAPRCIGCHITYDKSTARLQPGGWNTQ